MLSKILSETLMIRVSIHDFAEEKTQQITEMPKSKKGQEKYQNVSIITSLCFQVAAPMDCCQCKTKCLPCFWGLNTVFFQAPGALGLVPIESVDVKFRHVIPFYDLKVSHYRPLSCVVFLFQQSSETCFLPDSVAPVCSPVELLP